MKDQRNIMNLAARFLFALLAVVFFAPGLRAQTPPPQVENRLLLVFDTSSAMKKRLPAEEKAINKLFAITLNGQIRGGDSIGIWTFSKDLHTGQYPLQHWEPADIMTTPIDIVSFLKKQRYSRTTSFDALMPLLNQIVRHSPRLTVLIFCDGNGQIKGTPADDTINGVFKQNQSIMEKEDDPFVIVLRSQFGKYTGFTVSTSDSISLPQFPPLPQPVMTPPAPAPQPPPPAPTPAPLIIIGNNVGTNPPAPASTPSQPPANTPPPAPATTTPANPPPPAESTPPLSENVSPSPEPPANTPLPASPAPETNPVPSVAVSEPPTNAAAPPPPATPPPVAAASSTSQPQPDSGLSIGSMVAIGGGIIVAAGVVTFLMMRSLRHRHSPSLITESLKKR
jgi:hypothetical protein